MEDVIFNGTDKAKPHGMAEVITLADYGSTLASIIMKYFKTSFSLRRKRLFP